MFYSQFILAKKGPLGTIWIAAHLEGKLRKNHVTDTNISTSIDSILYPEVPIALRLSGHLLLGVVRIYSCKVNYLFHDCSEALVKIKHAFHCSSVDLPPDASKVPFHSITLPETFDFDELEAARWDKLHASSGGFVVDHHVSARELITLREQTNEETHTSLFHPDDRFLGSSDPYSLLYESDEEHDGERSHASNLKASLLQENGGSALEEDVLPPLQMDEMDIERENMDFMQDLGGTEQGGPSPIHLSKHFDVGLPGSSQSARTEKSVNLASGSEFPSPKIQDIPDIEKLRSVPEQREPEPFFMELEEEGVPGSNMLKKAGISRNAIDDLGPHDIEATPILDETPLLNRLSPSTVGDLGNYTGNEDVLGSILGGKTPALKVASISRDGGPESAQRKRGRRKRKAVFDDKQVLPSVSMKKQLAGAADLLRPHRNIPLTEFGLWRMQDTYNDQRFERPSFPGFSAPIKELYSRVTRLSATEQSNCPTTPLQDAVNSCANDVLLDAIRMAEVDIPLADIDPLDRPEAPSFSPLGSLQNARQTPSADASCVHNEELERWYTGSVPSEQEDKGAQEPEVGVHDTLPEELDRVISVEVNNRLIDNEMPEALATQASGNAVDVAVKPLHSASSAPTPGHMLEKLDFLEDNRDKASFHSYADPDGNEHFVDEMHTSYQKRAKVNQNNNGWSVRTKCVAKYLKSIFEEAEATSQSQVSLDSLLKGRTRKEAARMYFETLVLKSRDYIHVEQRSGFAEILLSATPLLRKAIL